MSMLDVLTGKNDTDNYAVVPIPQRLMKNEKVVIITADNTEDLEFFYPYYRLTEAGYTVDVVTTEGGAVKAKHGLELKNTKSIDEVRPEEYKLLYLPGGKAPAELRKNDAVLNFVKQFVASGKPVAAVCHGPQILVSANVIQGKQLAAYPEVKEEIEKAGGKFVDEALVIDGQFITARKPGDLHRHLSGVMEYLGGNVSNVSRMERKAS